MVTRTVTAIFDSPAAAGHAVETLKTYGIPDDHVSTVTRAEEKTHSPVTGKRAGAVVGGVLGMGAATFLVPGLGPVFGMGLLAGALAGAGAGAVAGRALERGHELYFFEEALRAGGAVVAVEPRDEAQETQVRNLLEQAGGRSVESVRREWVQAQRKGEREYALSRGLDFDSEEPDYWAGYEAALHRETRGRQYDEVLAYIQTCYPEPCQTEAFRLGYDRGQQHLAGRTGGREAT